MRMRLIVVDGLRLFFAGYAKNTGHQINFYFFFY